MKKDAYVRKQEKQMVYWKKQGEDEKDEADHVLNENEDTNNAHHMSDDRNAFDILAWCALTT